MNLGDSYASTNPHHNHNGVGKLTGSNLKNKEIYSPNEYVEIPNGLKQKDLCGIPWRVAFALQQPDYVCKGCGEINHSSLWGRFPKGRLICPSCELSKGHSVIDGWYLRSDIIWSKPNPMPESVTDRPTKAHEYLFLLSKKPKYFYDNEAVREPHTEANQKDFEARQKRGSLGWGDGSIAKNTQESGITHYAKVGRSREEFHNPAGRNRRTVWEIATQPTPDAHFATFPEALVEPCIKAGTSERGCCPVCGASWERVVEKGLTAHDGETNSQYQKNTTANRLALLRQAARERGEEYTSEKKTLGWQPSCTCSDDDTLPCTVLDPFGGSGTTGLVARNLKRDAILIELNTEYVKIMKKKLRLNEQLVV